MSSRWCLSRVCSGTICGGINRSFFAGSAFYSSFYSHGSEYKFCHWLSCEYDEVPDIRENCYSFSVMKPASFHRKGCRKKRYIKREQSRIKCAMKSTSGQLLVHYSLFNRAVSLSNHRKQEILLMDCKPPQLPLYLASVVLQKDFRENWDGVSRVTTAQLMYSLPKIF